MFVFVMPLLSKVKVIEPSQGEIKLNPIIKMVGTLALPEPDLKNEYFTNRKIPRFISITDQNFSVAVVIGKKIFLLDGKFSKIVKTISIENVSDIFKFKDIEDLFIFHNIGDKGMFSRINCKTDNLLWTSDINVQSNFAYNLENISYPGGFLRVFIPIIVTYNSGKKQIMLCGIEFNKKRDKFMNILLFIDEESGKILKEKKFHFRRFIKDDMEFFYNKDTREFEIIHFSTGDPFMKGKVDYYDMLFKYGNMYKIGLTPPIDGFRLEEDPQYPVYLLPWEISPILTKKELIITSRHINVSSKKLIKASWVRYDLKGNHIGTVTPLPRSAADLIIRNQGNNNWPIILPQLIPEHESSRGREMNGLILIDQVGNIKSLPLPLFPSKRFYFGGIFHDGEKIYKLEKVGLYMAKMGETNATQIFKFQKKRHYYDASSGQNEMVVLKGMEDATLIKLTDGKEISLDERIEGKNMLLQGKVSDFYRTNQPLPKYGLPVNFKSYSKKFGNYAWITDFEIESYNLEVTRKVGRIWGLTGEDGKYGDIAIIPCILKDKSAVILGILIPDNKVVFWVPTLRIKETDRETPFPFGLKKLSRERALFFVFERLNLLKVYSIQRPEINKFNLN